MFDDWRSRSRSFRKKIVLLEGSFKSGEKGDDQRNNDADSFQIIVTTG